MSMLARISRALERVLVAICITLMVTLAVIVVWAVIYRRLGISLRWYDEVASIILAWITYYGAALAALKRAHLGFPNLVMALPPTLRVPLLVVTEGLVLFFFALVAWFGWQVLELLHGDTLISLTWMPVQVTQSVIPIGAVLFIVAEVLTLPEKFREAMRGEAIVEGEHALEGEPR